jgi:hypothetical protein
VVERDRDRKVERDPQGKHLVRQHAEGVHVARRSVRLPYKQLRRRPLQSEVKAPPTAK